MQHMMPNGPWGPIVIQQEPRPQIDVIVPARVDKALEFIAMMSSKTMQRAVTNDTSIELIDGQKLTDDESTAVNAACNLLTAYFAGSLEPDTWERTKVESAKMQAKLGGQTGSLLNCVACSGNDHPQPNCRFCSGTGRVLVTPAS